LDEADGKIIDYFFTNREGRIFGAKNMHPEVWALMQARYSRAKEGLRESFLSLLKEDPKNFQKLLSEIEKNDGGIQSKAAIDKAIQFMEKWVLGYGHASVAEGATVGLGLEGVSILATKTIEDNRLASYIEKSTRYVSFDKSSFYIDPQLEDSEFFPEITALLSLLIETYQELQEPVLEHVKRHVPFKEGTSKTAWERACAARRFDAIRYLLPTATKTSLGWTINARALAHAIEKLLSSPLAELNGIGEETKREAEKLLPSLLRFAEKNWYLSETNSRLTAEGVSQNQGSCQKGVRLVSGPDNAHAEELVLASIIYRFGNLPFKDAEKRAREMSPDAREELFAKYLGKMGKFDYPQRELEHIQLTFEIVMDYGAFRDLQRHRIATQTVPLFTTDLGYDVPEDIIASGCGEKYRAAMDEAKRVFDLVREKLPIQAQYIVPLGYRRRFLITMNLREIHHFVKTRTTSLAHESYRKIAYQIFEETGRKYPLLSKYIVCNYTEEELGRLRAETATEKREGIGPL